MRCGHRNFSCEAFRKFLILAAIVSAAVLTDASNIEDGITALKQRVTGLAPAGSALTLYLSRGSACPS